MQDIFQGISELRRFAFMLSCVVRFPNPNHSPVRHHPPTTGTPKITTIKLFLPVKLYYRLPQQEEQNRQAWENITTLSLSMAIFLPPSCLRPSHGKSTEGKSQLPNNAISTCAHF